MIFLVTEYAQGGTLRELIDQTKQANRKLDLKTIGLIAAQIIMALEFCHSRGFSHEELEPENVFLCKEKICVCNEKYNSFSWFSGEIGKPWQHF